MIMKKKSFKVNLLNNLMSFLSLYINYCLLYESKQILLPTKIHPFLGVYLYYFSLKNSKESLINLSQISGSKSSTVVKGIASI